MTLLTVCQNATDYVGLTQPTAVIGQASDDARRLRSSVRATAKDLINRKFPDLLRVGSITFDGSDLYDEPSDLNEYVSDTFWTNLDRFAAGPINPQVFQRLLENGTVTVDPIHRIRQTDDATNFRRQMEVYPTQASGTLNFLYWSNQPFKNTAGTTRLADWTTDTDDTIGEEYVYELGVIWRMLRSMRRNYAEEFNQYEAYVERRLAAASVGRVIDIRRTLLRPIANTPEAGFGT